MKSSPLKSDSYKTVLTIITGLLIFFYFFNNEYLFYLILFIGISSVLSQKVSLFYEKIWFTIAYILGLFIPNIVLSIIFYFFLTPIAFIYKLFGNDVLMLNNKKYSSYFLNAKYDMSKKSFEKIW